MKKSKLSRSISSFLITILLGSIVGLAIFLEKPTCQVEGIILTESGTPIAHAVVSTGYGENTKKAFTDEFGKFNFRQLPIGEHSFRVKAKGYNQFYYKKNYTTQEGEVLQLPETQLVELSPALYASLWNRTRSLDEKTFLSIDGAKVKEVYLKLYQINLIDYLKNGGKIEQITNGDITEDELENNYFKVVKEWKEQIPEEDIPEFEKKLAIPVKEKGIYLIKITAASTDRKKVFSEFEYFNFTDIGFVIKQAPQQWHFYAQTFSQNKEVENAKIYIFDSNMQMHQLETNAQGLAIQKLENLPTRGERLPVAILNYQGSYAFMRIGSEYEEYLTQNTDGKPKIFSYTERPLYRPGQKVYFKGILRHEKNDGSYELLADAPIEVEVSNNRGDILFQETLHTNRYGSYWGQLELGEEAELGYYEIKSSYKDNTHNDYFEVDEYRKPEFKLEIEAGKKRFFSGEKVDFNINAQYYFGAPVEAELEYSLYETYDYSTTVENEWDAAYPYYSEYGGGYGQFIQEGTLKTDQNGRATLSLEIPQAKHNRRLSLRVTAKDASDRSVTKEGEAFVAAADFYFRTRQETYLANPQKPFPLFVRTSNYQGQGVSRPFQIKVQRETWDSRKSDYDYKTEKTFEGKTDPKGMTKIMLSFEKAGYYRLLIEGKDPQGRLTEYSDYAWVSGSIDDDDGFGLQKDLVVISDKKKYSPGEKAKLFIVSPIKDAKIWLTVEGLDIYESRIENIPGFSKEIEVELKRAWLPNVEIQAALIGKKAFYQSVTPIDISAKEKFLNVELKSRAKEYKPGETIEYQIQTKDQNNQPVSAELSLGVVDEKIYALKTDTTNIKEGFWGPRENRVSTDFSFSGYYSGGIAKEDQANLRRNFKDTAYWIPSLITDEKGQASLSFKLPDNLTTWRATAIAQTPDTHVGQTIYQTIATKDLLVRLALPRFFTERDQVTLKALVQNYSDRTQDVKTSLDLKGKGLQFKQADEGKDRRFQIKANQTASFDFTVQATEPGTAVIQFLAKADKDSDGVEWKVPVLPYGIEEHRYHQGEIDPADVRASLELAVPPQTKLSSSQVHLSLDTSLAGQLLGSVNYLVEYPYGCVEQTTSRILPALIVADLYQTLDINDPMLKRKIPQVVKMGLKRLAAMQHNDGGWGWWKHDDTHLYMTSYALFGLLRAQSLGVQVDQEMLKRAKEALEDLLEKNQSMAQITSSNSAWEQEKYYFAYYVASLAKLKKLPSISTQRLPQNILSRAYLILALAEQGRDVEALDLSMQLSRETICNGEKCYFSEKTDSQHNYGNYNRAEVTAWALQAILKADPQNRSLAESLSKWLLAQRRGGRWRHTRETAAAIYALSAYAKSESGLQSGIRASLQLGEKKLLDINESMSHWEDQINELPLKQGQNKFLIENLGENKLYYQSDISFYVQENQLAPSSSGIEVKREYFMIEEVRQKGSDQVSYKLQEVKNKIPKGAKIGVRISINSPENYDYLIIEDPLPAGFEVIKDSENFDEKALSYTEKEVHDEKVVFFATYLREGQHVLNYIMQPELIGKLNALPTQAYEMYRPEKRGSSASQVLEVE
ncbi:MAG: carboxypeptidase regulatory-like domain-containing protein [Deltaproteobacteria bacterium]|nr:carboxypeptidase regulatory-like domain-containing protein [Deltaproteobacteria bacterium]